jgi:hypothetical protein
LLLGARQYLLLQKRFLLQMQLQHACANSHVSVYLRMAVSLLVLLGCMTKGTHKHAADL